MFRPDFVLYTPSDLLPEQKRTYENNLTHLWQALDGGIPERAFPPDDGQTYIFEETDPTRAAAERLREELEGGRNCTILTYQRNDLLPRDGNRGNAAHQTESQRRVGALARTIYETNTAIVSMTFPKYPLLRLNRRTSSHAIRNALLMYHEVRKWLMKRALLDTASEEEKESSKQLNDSHRREQKYRAQCAAWVLFEKEITPALTLGVDPPSAAKLAEIIQERNRKASKQTAILQPRRGDWRARDVLEVIKQLAPAIYERHYRRKVIGIG